MRYKVNIFFPIQNENEPDLLQSWSFDHVDSFINACLYLGNISGEGIHGSKIEKVHEAKLELEEETSALTLFAIIKTENDAGAIDTYPDIHQKFEEFQKEDISSDFFGPNQYTGKTAPFFEPMERIFFRTTSKTASEEDVQRLIVGINKKSCSNVFFVACRQEVRPWPKDGDAFSPLDYIDQFTSRWSKTVSEPTSEFVLFAIGEEKALNAIQGYFMEHNHE